MRLVLLNKDYDSESLCDVGRDVMECFDPKFNPNAELVNKYYPQDRHGFSDAIYRVQISVDIPFGTLNGTACFFQTCIISTPKQTGHTSSRTARMEIC